MKIRTLILSGLVALSLAFSLTTSREAKASTDLGFSFEVLMGNGEAGTGTTRSCALYCGNGQQCGTLIADVSNPGKLVLTFQTNGGSLVVEENWGDSVTVPSGNNDSIVLSAGEYTRILEATGVFKGVTSVMHRCVYALDAEGLPSKCINCLYAMIRDHE